MWDCNSANIAHKKDSKTGKELITIALTIWLKEYPSGSRG